MTTPFERRVAAIERKLRAAHDGPIDPRQFVLLTLFGFYSDRCARRDREHPLEACSRLTRGLDDDKTVVPALMREFFAAHGIDDPDYETESTVSAMQRLLDPW